MIWIVDIPPDYDGLDITSPAITYILITEPSATIVAQVEERGGSIRAFEDPFGGSGNVTVNVDGSGASLNDEGDGNYSVDIPDQYETEIEITIDDGADAIIELDPYYVYQRYNFVVGNVPPALPLWCSSGSNNYVYKINNDSGLTMKTIIDSDLQYMGDASFSNFIASDNGYLYFFLPIDEGYPISSHMHLWVYDPDGSGVEILDHSGGASGGSSFIAFDRVQGVLYAEFQGTTSSSYSTLYAFTEAGASLGSVERLKLNWTLGIDCMAAYDGNVIYAHQKDGGSDPCVIQYGGSDIFSMSGSYDWVSNIVAPADGYVYALYKKQFRDDFNLIKVSPDTGLVWTYPITGATELYLYNAPALFVNDQGVSMVLLKHTSTAKTTKVDTDGNLIWEKIGAYRHIDNNENYFQ